MNRAFVVCATALVLMVVCASSVPAQDSVDRFGESVRLYRRGEREKAIAAVGPIISAEVQRRDYVPPEIADWIAKTAGDDARTSRARPSLEAALLLLTETYYSSDAAAGAPSAVFDLFTTTRRLNAAILHAHRALVSLSPRTPFLKLWYLIWDAYRQGRGQPPVQPDYLMMGVKAFPGDADLMLSAGSRYEVYWWNADDNPQREPENKGSNANVQLLRTAAEWFRKTIAADPGLTEAHLRLGRVLTLLGDLETAGTELRAYVSAAKDPGSKYLGFLFLGEVCERRGERAEAAAAYASAVELIPVAQSARLAAGRLAHEEGRRAAAAESVEKAFSKPDQGSDPWWWYVRGQWWQASHFLDLARAHVRQ